MAEPIKGHFPVILDKPGSSTEVFYRAAIVELMKSQGIDPRILPDSFEQIALMFVAKYDTDTSYDAVLAKARAWALAHGKPAKDSFLRPAEGMAILGLADDRKKYDRLITGLPKDQKHKEGRVTRVSIHALRALAPLLSDYPDDSPEQIQIRYQEERAKKPSLD